MVLLPDYKAIGLYPVEASEPISKLYRQHALTVCIEELVIPFGDNQAAQEGEQTPARVDVFVYRRRHIRCEIAAVGQEYDTLQQGSKSTE